MYDKYLQIAANIFGGDIGLLHYELCNKLRQLSNFINSTGGKLISRQLIALKVQEWIIRNPDKKAYGE